MSDLQPFTLTGKNNGVIPHHITNADATEPNRVAIPLAGSALAAINRNLGKIPTQRIGHDLTQTECRPGRCINLVAMMRFDNFDVSAVSQCLGGRLGQFESEVHARRKI